MGNREVEVWGVLYERFSVCRKEERIAEKYDIKSVAEMPAHGAKAMPSVYSLGFGKHADSIALINGNPAYESEWRKLGFEKKLSWVSVDDLLHTGLPDRAYDLVWNFAYIPTCSDPDALIEEMKRLSRKYVMILTVNKGNIGFPIHRLVHRKTGIPWTHGDIRYNSRHFIRKKLQEHGMKIVETGFMDCPVWPDSLGFRDVRLHRMNVDFNRMDWETPFTDMYKANKYPTWYWLVYCVEKFPMPKFLKSVHSHLNYTIAEIGE